MDAGRAWIATARATVAFSIVVGVFAALVGCNRRPLSVASDANNANAPSSVDGALPASKADAAASVDGALPASKADAAAMTAGAEAGVPLPACCVPWPPAATGWVEVGAATPELRGFVVRSAWAAGRDDIFFAGAAADSDAGVSYGKRIVRFSRGCWSLDFVQPGPGRISSVFGTGPDDVWAADGNIYHRDALGWSRVDDGAWRPLVTIPGRTTGAGVYKVQPLSRDEVWAVGSGDGYDDYGSNSFVLRWSRAADQPWRAFLVDEIDPRRIRNLDFYGFGALWAAGHDDVWVGGSLDSEGTTMPPGVYFHYDGQAWAVHGTVYPKEPSAFSGLPEGEIWMAIAGGSTSGQPGASLRHFAQGTWSDMIVPGLPFESEDFASVWARAPDDVWAAGADVVHWDGSAAAIATDAPADLRHAYALVTGDAGSVWLVGAGRFYRLAR